MRRTAPLLLAALLATGCVDEFGFGPGAGADVREVSGGKIDPNDPQRTLTTALSGETVGNAEQEPAIATTKGFREYLDTRLELARQLEAEDKGQVPDYLAVVTSADRALRSTPDDELHREQRARTLELRATAYARAASRANEQAFRDRERGRDVSGYMREEEENTFSSANDYADAARATTNAKKRGQLYADAAYAYSRSGRSQLACAMAAEAVRSVPDPETLSEMAVLRGELACK